MTPSNERKKIVVFGGGTGLSTLVRGLKKYSIDLTAVVTVADDGGSSGRLLDQYDIPPPGDVRKVMAALSDVEPLIEQLFQYRFTAQDGLNGHSLGNLMLAAMTDITGDFASAVRKMGQVLNIEGKVLPAANERITLHAELEDGTLVTGESKIPMYARKIHRVYLSPQDAKPLPETLQAIREADLIIIGPGSLYTSILPSLLVQDIRHAVLQSNAQKVYVVNLTTQKGETFQYTASEHVTALYDHVGEPFLDAVLLNSKAIMPLLTAAGQTVTSLPVECDLEKLQALVPTICQEDIALAKNDRVLHDAEKVAQWFVKYITR